MNVVQETDIHDFNWLSSLTTFINPQTAFVKQLTWLGDAES
jgi:hypothetical protein